MNVQAYLARINYDGPLDCSPRTLRRLHMAHLLTVPFENLSLRSGERTTLESKSLFDKIVTRRRGGMCSELNPSFGGLLRTLGFRVGIIQGEVPTRDRGFENAVAHVALLVQMQERWLADVGFGLTFRQPLRVDYRKEQVHADGRIYRVEVDGEKRLIKHRMANTDWRPLYRFDLRPRPLSYFGRMWRHKQDFPRPPFSEHRICCLDTSDGWVVLNDRNLIAFHGDQQEKQELASERACRQVLLDKFGLTLPVAQHAVASRNRAAGRTPGRRKHTPRAAHSS